MTAAELDLHTHWPSVYLDQWVWIRLAKAGSGEPREKSDTAVLAAVRQASAAGVAFPLSSTHYMETSKITSPRQRGVLARMTASVSRCCTLRSRRILLRHQMLHAMHLSFGRPAFRPQPPEVLSTGVMWALTGQHVPLGLRGPDGPVDPATIPGMPEFLRKAGQFAEMHMLAGPADEEIEKLRQLGYRPEAAEDVVSSRLDWERTYTGLLANDPVTRPELRVRVQAREILHEHFALFRDLIAEYNINLSREIGPGSDPDRAQLSRRRMVTFADLMPSVRIAVDLKAELFRNAAKTWTMGAIHDIDALSMAVPYCHVVVPDREMADLLSRSRTGLRTGTQIVPGLGELPDVLTDLTDRARSVSGAAAGWGWDGPGEEFCLDLADLRSALPGQPPQGEQRRTSGRIS